MSAIEGFSGMTLIQGSSFTTKEFKTIIINDMSIIDCIKVKVAKLYGVRIIHPMPLEK
jgi:hypothetical protein